LDLKTQGVSNKPDLKIIEINKDHKYLIIASDGLWDVIDDQVFYHFFLKNNNINFQSIKNKT
jgi:serine/threonine protein phosphatase PrpC